MDYRQRITAYIWRRKGCRNRRIHLCWFFVHLNFLKLFAQILFECDSTKSICKSVHYLTKKWNNPKEHLLFLLKSIVAHVTFAGRESWRRKRSRKKIFGRSVDFFGVLWDYSERCGEWETGIQKDREKRETAALVFDLVVKIQKPETFWCVARRFPSWNI